MKKLFMKRHEENWLRIPYEENADPCIITISDSTGKKEIIRMKVSETRVDYWMAYPLKEFSGDDIQAEGPANRWINAIELSDNPEKQRRRELSKSVIQYMPPTGCIQELKGVKKAGEKWILDCVIDPCSMTGIEENQTAMCLVSKDLLHWKREESELPGIESICRKADKWIGDIEQQIEFEEDGKIWILGQTAKKTCEGVAASNAISIPSVFSGEQLKPAAQVDNLRVWVRQWHNEHIDKKFEFLMRFRQGPDVWPEVRLLAPENIVSDIQTKACEVELEMFVGQETEIEFELCGVKWIWKALDQTLNCRGYKMKVPTEKGRLYLHFYRDMAIQELYADRKNAMLIVQDDGPKKEDYKIRSEQVENINNPSFYLQYNAEPYFEIHTNGKTASVICLNIWGLRSTRYEEENRLLIKQEEKGQPLFKSESYTVYENCVEDRIYGEPAAWAVRDGKTVLSPVRAVEEFCWRDTPWGDMTRIQNRTERWDAPEESVYPSLHTKHNVINAAFSLATDIMCQNRNKKYALPGQEGLMNAAVFQREGEGFGSWVRDTCHAAFRCQNLLAPDEARESLSYISEHGFNNGVDCAAMPAIAAWDHYITTGDIQLLYEMLPGIIKYAEEADARYDEEMQLIHATMCLAQDAFEEPENGGYCLGTEITFALMYQDVARICKVTGCYLERIKFWENRAEEMFTSIKEKYWNEEKECFTSGPIGSEAYEKGWWETTGAEMVLWPRFGIATERQRNLFLKTIESNPEAFSEFGINWYPFRKEKNHFWRACWVSWTLGLSEAAGESGNKEFLKKLIYAQVRNVLLNKSFHEVMDVDTGRAWRWPHLPWHAAGFIGFIVNGIFGIRYSEQGIQIHPCILDEFEGAVLDSVPYQNAKFVFEIHGHGDSYTVKMDGNLVEGSFGKEMTGEHKVDIYAYETE